MYLYMFCGCIQSSAFIFQEMGFPCGSAVNESTCNAGDLSSIPGLGRCPGEGKDYPLQYSGLENSMDCIVHGVSKSWTQLSDFHFHTFLCMKCSLGIFNFLEEISSLSHSIVFLYFFFSLFTSEGFLISPCSSLELCIQMGISFHCSFAFSFSFLSYL